MTTRFFHPLITAKKRLPVSVRLRDVVLTILLWWAYLYFMKDLFVFIADVARWGCHGFRDVQNYKSFEVLPTLLSYAGIMVVFAMIYIGWARYNQMRFRGKTRRRAVMPVEAEDIAKFYGLETRQVESWQQAKILTIHHNDRGRIIEVE